MKRGQSGLSLVVGVHKPTGMSSHDVVNACRRIFGESRVGHAGTLDPLASGALLVCVGPATRLNAFMTAQDKGYRFRVSFGRSTETDDAEGAVTKTGSPPEEVLDQGFAQGFVAGLVGRHRQMPPVYSAVKVGGKRSYQAARAGNIIELNPRDIEIYESRLLAIGEKGDDGLPFWEIAARVSKGTYIRSLARDIGLSIGCPSYVSLLERESIGSLMLEDCLGLDALQERREQAALDPVRLLGLRVVFARGEAVLAVSNGRALPARDCPAYSYRNTGAGSLACSCTSGISESPEPFTREEMVSIVAENKLVALYCYNTDQDRLEPRCVFSTGVSRGNNP